MLKKFENFIVAHWDADGLISVSLFYKKFEPKNFYTTFTSVSLFNQTLLKIISKNQLLKNLFVFDLSGDKMSFNLANCFEKCTWIDHHVVKEKSNFENIQFIVDEKAKSCAEVVAKHFNLNSRLVEIANQIDSNNVKNGRAEFFRNYIAAVKWKYGKFPAVINNIFRQLAKNFSKNGFEDLENSIEAHNLIDEFITEILKEEKNLLSKARFFEIKGMKVCICEVDIVPAFRVFDFLKSNKEFDLLALIYRKNDRTKIEFRSDEVNVFKIAKFFGGGGHENAAGASINKMLTADEIVSAIEKIY